MCFVCPDLCGSFSCGFPAFPPDPPFPTALTRSDQRPRRTAEGRSPWPRSWSDHTCTTLSPSAACWAQTLSKPIAESSRRRPTVPRFSTTALDPVCDFGRTPPAKVETQQAIRSTPNHHGRCNRKLTATRGPSPAGRLSCLTVGSSRGCFIKKDTGLLKALTGRKSIRAPNADLVGAPSPPVRASRGDLPASGCARPLSRRRHIPCGSHPPPTPLRHLVPSASIGNRAGPCEERRSSVEPPADRAASESRRRSRAGADVCDVVFLHLRESSASYCGRDRLKLWGPGSLRSLGTAMTWSL